MESKLWLEFCSGHSNVHVPQACSINVSPSKFWSLADLYPDFVSRLHIQVRLMGNLCLNGGIPWLFNTEGSLLFYMQGKHRNGISQLYCVSPFWDTYSSLWSNLKTKIINFNQTDSITKSDFITNLYPHKKVYYCWEGSVSLFMMLQ